MQDFCRRKWAISFTKENPYLSIRYKPIYDHPVHKIPRLANPATVHLKECIIKFSKECTTTKKGKKVSAVFHCHQNMLEYFSILCLRNYLKILRWNVEVTNITRTRTECQLWCGCNIFSSVALQEQHRMYKFCNH